MQTSLCSVENFQLLRFRCNEGFSFQGHISFKPTLDQQRNCANCSQSLLDGDFTVRYDVKRTTPDNLQVNLTAGNCWTAQLAQSQGSQLLPEGQGADNDNTAESKGAFASQKPAPCSSWARQTQRCQWNQLRVQVIRGVCGDEATRVQGGKSGCRVGSRSAESMDRNRYGCGTAGDQVFLQCSRGRD